jgi:hypothetical protein
LGEGGVSAAAARRNSRPARPLQMTIKDEIALGSSFIVIYRLFSSFGRGPARLFSSFDGIDLVIARLPVSVDAPSARVMCWTVEPGARF